MKPNHSESLAHNYLSRRPHRADSVELTLVALGKQVLRFRNSRYFRPFYLAILGIIVTGLFQFTGASQPLFCLGTLLIPTTALVIPYWAGERKLKDFAVNALPIFAIAVLLVSAFQTQAVLDQRPAELSTGLDPATANVALPHLTMWNGTVEPFRGSPGQTYTFRVRLKEVNATGAVIAPQNVTTFSANITSYNPFPAPKDIIVPMHVDANASGASNGTWYIGTTTLSDSVYSFFFWANDTRGNYTYAAAPVLEPMTAGAGSFYLFWLVNVGLYMVFPLSFYFIIVFMYWYTIRMRKMRERMMDRARGEKLDLDKGGPKEGAAEGGGGTEAAAPTDTAWKTKKAAAFTCTNCGADVSEDDVKCPKCGAVFED